MKFSIKNFTSKYDQIPRLMRLFPYLQKQILNVSAGAHLRGGPRGSGPLPFFDTVQIAPSNS